MTATKPIPSVIKTNRNGILIATVAPLWIKPDAHIVDVTYGRGAWWTHYKHPGRFTAHDIDTSIGGDGVDFTQLPENSRSVDAVFFDPPYVAPGGRATSTIPAFNQAYGLVDVPKTPALADQLIASGVVETGRILKTGGLLFVKTMNYITSGRFHPGHRRVCAVAEAAGLVQVDEFVHHSGTGPQPSTNPDGTPRRQVHARSAHSFLVVFKKTRP